MKDIEIEIQVQIENAKPLKKFLVSRAKLVSESRQVDKYFIPPHRNFLDKKPIEEWLRLRDSDGKHSITYKKWYYSGDGRSTHADEYESSIGSLEQLQKIFEVLNFNNFITVDKKRQSYLYQDYEISLDTVKGLGDFVEIEFKGKVSKKSPAEITAEMIKLLKDIGVGKVVRNYVGYPFMIIYPGEGKFEEV